MVHSIKHVTIMLRDLQKKIERAWTIGYWQLLLAPLAIIFFGTTFWLMKPRIPLAITGIVWQVDRATLGIDGNWQDLGADHLLIQWSEVDGVPFLNMPETQQPKALPDWERIAAEPWARAVILGLAGDFSEKASRSNTLLLARKSARIAKLSSPLNIVGYYFPVEVDPSWKAAPEIMVQALALLPRPLWISVYDRGNIGGDALSEWLSTWLPGDVGIFFQDGVGVEARAPSTARKYADALRRQFGKDRVKVIVEAFRPLNDGRFRPATTAELTAQLKAMQGMDIYLFDGPHYLNEDAVNALLRAMNS